MKVAVLGPNGLNDATFHVHRAGCKDVKRMERMLFMEPAWHMEANSVREVVECCYEDFIGTEETFGRYGHQERYTTWEDYVGEIRFLPCCIDGLDKE